MGSRFRQFFIQNDKSDVRSFVVSILGSLGAGLAGVLFFLQVNPLVDAHFTHGIFLTVHMVFLFFAFGLVAFFYSRLQKKKYDFHLASDRLHAIIEAEPECLKLLDAQGCLLEMNPAGLRIIEADSFDQVRGQCVYPMVVERDRNAFTTLTNQVFQGQAGALQFEIEGLKGGRRWLETNAVPLYDHHDKTKINALLAVTRDITERKQTEVALCEAKEAAEVANLTKSTFLANMSHEIRTPLGAIIGFSELVSDQRVGPSEKSNYVAAIKRNGELLSNIINDILDLSKVEAGKLNVRVRETALAEVLTDTKTLLSLQAQEQGITLTVTVADDVPEIINTDPLRLRQVLMNIVGNAIKFTSHGSVDVAVKFASIGNGRKNLSFVVQDTGQGIAKDQVGKLFAPFSQVDADSKRKHGGTGLGLILSKRLANLLGGDVVLTQSEFGKGSTFTITVDPGPIRGAFYGQAKAEYAQPLVPSSNVRLDGVRVLLVDDAIDNQLLVGRFLKMAGATVEGASNGKEAIEMIHRGRYDIVLMDLQMPVMDGYEATAELRKEGYGGQIMALTAHALLDEKQKCLRSGFNDHMSKPINRNALIERIDRFRKLENTQQNRLQ